MIEIVSMATMLIDHIGAIFFPDISIFRAVGRITLPLYSFMIVRGYKNTASFSRYIFRLLILAIISQPLTMYLFSRNRLNIIFTYVICLMILRSIHERKLLQVIFYTLLLYSFNFEASIYTLLLIFLFTFVQNEKYIIFLHFLLNVIYIPFYGFIQMFAVCGTVIAFLLKKPLPQLYRKYYRCFYPLHLFILSILYYIS